MLYGVSIIQSVFFLFGKINNLWAANPEVQELGRRVSCKGNSPPSAPHLVGFEPLTLR